MPATEAPPPPPRAVINWLLIVTLMIVAMVVIGGITRLTGSGLSMVEWRPLIGWLPPLDDAAWVEAFDKYKESPQYLKVNAWMTLADFKDIFFWEYFHRLFGRLIGLVLIVPWAWFLARRRMSRRLTLQTLGAFVLGGLQGLLGWFMVASGLVDVPAVSHYRLAAHLSAAFVLIAYLLWVLSDQLPARAPDDPASAAAGARPPPSRRWILAFAILLAVQIVYGAFMAGTRAGFISSTFPDMNGEWVPSAFLAMDPWLLDLVENPTTIHFLHRVLGWVLVFAGVALWWHVERRARTPRQRLAGRLVGGVTVLQVTAGFLVVILYVPVWIAATHQAIGVLLWSATMWLWFATGRPRAPEAASAGAGPAVVSEADGRPSIPATPVGD